MFEDEEYFDDNYFQNFDEEYFYDSNFGFRSYSSSDEDFDNFEDYHDFSPSVEEEYYEDRLYGNYSDDHYYENDSFGNFLDDWH